MRQECTPGEMPRLRAGGGEPLESELKLRDLDLPRECLRGAPCSMWGGPKPPRPLPLPLPRRGMGSSLQGTRTSVCHLASADSHPVERK